MRSFVVLICMMCLCGCVVSSDKHLKQEALLISKKEDIPDIKKTYKSEISQLHVGMSRGQVVMLFPNAEAECYPSGVCNITIFDERRIKLSPKLAGLESLTTGIVSLLALTCIVIEEECTEALFAMLNVGIASSIERNKLHNTEDGSISLIQWINIELVEQKVTQWAINEPLEQFRPKSLNNKLPPLEEALSDKNE